MANNSYMNSSEMNNLNELHASKKQVTKLDNNLIKNNRANNTGKL